MVEYLSIDRKEQSSLVKYLKTGSNLTWQKICRELNVDRSMVYFYRNGMCRIPKEKLQLLIKLAKSDIVVESLPFVNGNYTLQMATISNMNEDMAEFLGILYGDRCLGKDNFLVDVSGDSNSDFLYHTKHVAPLFRKLFGLSPRFKFDKEKDAMHTLLTAKMVHHFIAHTFSFPIGEKKGKMSIPKVISENEKYKRAFVRGLFDTDGGIHRHHLHSVQLHFTSLDKRFLNLVWNLFLDLKFNAKIGEEDIWIFDRNEVIRFFDEVKPANQKHLYKFQRYLETGIVPRHRDINYTVLNAGAGN